jgi:hypothetical protein
MTSDKSIFYLPFHPNRKLRPRPEQMKAFLAIKGKDGGKGLHDEDLAGYRRLLKSAEAFGQDLQQDAKRGDLHKRLVPAVLHYSRFADSNLLSAVELFQYHLHTLKLKSNDISRTASFIRSAEQTLSKLSKNKLTDVLRMVRLHEMINERKKIIEKLRPPALAITAELCRITLYIHGILAETNKRCQASIVILADPKVIRKKEDQIIDDLKERPQKALRAGKLAKHDLERAIGEINLIANKMSSVVGNDLNRLKDTYAFLQGQLRKAVQVIEAPPEEINCKKNRSMEELQQFFSAVEHSLVSLMSSQHLEKAAPDIPIEPAYKQFITKKREEILGYLFKILPKGRRSPSERRSSKARRKIVEPNYLGSRRRSGKDRRSGNDRRRSIVGSL